jgi:ABC-type glycerol-3-phosphate transport system permease component
MSESVSGKGRASSATGVKLRRFWSSFFKQLLMLLMAVSVIFPVYFMIITSFKTKMDYVGNMIGLPRKVVIANFATVFAGQSIFFWMLNSFIVTLGGVILSTAISALAAYAFSRIEFAGKEQIFNVLITLMVIPPVVMVIPLFITMVKAGLVNTYSSAVLVYAGLMIPFSIYLLRNFFITVPKAIVDSALIDGCTRFAAFLRIIVPLSAPAIVTLVIVNALWVWNELLIAIIFLQKTELRTLMVGLTIFQNRFMVNQPVIMAGLFLASIPMILLYLFGQKFFIRGMVGGSLKGE